MPSHPAHDQLATIARLLRGIVATCDPQERATAYFESTALIDELTGLPTLEQTFGDEDKARGRLLDLRHHLSIVAGVSKPDFSPVEEHHLAALGAIVGLELRARQTRSTIATNRSS